MYDLIIIGAGPAGITATVYAARKKMNFLVISGDIGGQAGWSGDIENYTGYQFITGPELASKFEEHMRKYGIAMKEGELVTDLKRVDDRVIIKTDKAQYESKTAIVASGKRSRELSVPGEKEFKNKGLTYCATCDGPLFAGKDVAVIGGGNSALDAVLQLIKIAHRIYLINMVSHLTGDPVMIEKVHESGIVTVMNNAKVLEITGDQMVSGIKVRFDGEDKVLSVGGIFVEIGLMPNSYFAATLDKNALGEIKVDCHNRTNIPGIFAAGDVTNVPEKQIIIAAGEGSKASLSAFKYLNQRR
ncbi:MAG: FAD-dependent oxidoreductase [Candidatus Omnitrophota bacterium]|nr:FAD-dependent oxidoreductase [Candidatus Omnitrophota bacterium]